MIQADSVELKVGQNYLEGIPKTKVPDPSEAMITKTFVRAEGESQLSNKVCRQIVNLYTASCPGKVVTHDDVQLRWIGSH
ncbi:unnamed protein product [Nezara viridula]|uniref:Uncharacterized protein n=1 Tax=Nezara viridula TaxID=85310 RepID=A0A9P0HBE4_NEZVI|nr:unnamed protein product [Nezara viridula]